MIPAVIIPNVAFVAIRAYAAYSYLYYDEGESLVSDHDFDMLCEWMLANYAAIKPHDLNGYVDKGALKAGTGYHLSGGKVCGLTKKWADEQLAEHKAKQRRSAKKPKKRVINDLAFLD